MDPRILLLLEGLDLAYDKRAWHGTTLRGSLRGLTPEVALWRPAPDRRCIWDYLLHAAYWKYCVRRRLAGDERGTFGRSPSNWPQVGATAADLRRDVRFLHEEHRRLREALAAFPADRLDRRGTARGPTFATLAHGIAAHDLYHTGQIQLLKRLAPG